MALAAAEGVFRHAPLAERLRRDGVPEPLARHRISEGQRRGGWWSIVGTFSPKVMKSGGIHRALEVAANTRAAGIGVYGVCMFETWLAHAADPT